MKVSHGLGNLLGNVHGFLLMKWLRPDMDTFIESGPFAETKQREILLLSCTTSITIMQNLDQNYQIILYICHNNLYFLMTHTNSCTTEIP